MSSRSPRTHGHLYFASALFIGISIAGTVGATTYVATDTWRSLLVALSIFVGAIGALGLAILILGRRQNPKLLLMTEWNARVERWNTVKCPTCRVGYRIKPLRALDDTPDPNATLAPGFDDERPFTLRCETCGTAHRFTPNGGLVGPVDS